MSNLAFLGAVTYFTVIGFLIGWVWGTYTYKPKPKNLVHKQWHSGGDGSGPLAMCGVQGNIANHSDWRYVTCQDCLNRMEHYESIIYGGRS